MRVCGMFRLLSGSAPAGLLPDAHRARRGGAELLGALSRRDLDLVGAALEAATALLAGRQDDRHDAVLADLAGHAGDDLAVAQEADLDDLRALGSEDHHADAALAHRLQRVPAVQRQRVELELRR